MEPRPLYERTFASEEDRDAALCVWSVRLRVLGRVSFHELVETAAWATHQELLSDGAAEALWNRITHPHEAA